jgi:hypothetical protein
MRYDSFNQTKYSEYLDSEENFSGSSLRFSD